MNVNALINLLNESLNYVQIDTEIDLFRLVNSLASKDTNIQEVIDELTKELEGKLTNGKKHNPQIIEEEAIVLQNNEYICDDYDEPSSKYYEDDEDNNYYETEEETEEEVNEVIDINYQPVEAENINYNFCTVAGKEYLIKVVTLYRSLVRHSTEATLWVCCMDDVVYKVLKKLNPKKMKIFKVEELETKELLKAKRERTASEYCWTLKAPIMTYIFDKYKVEDIIYSDSDICFFSDPKVIYDEWGENCAFLCRQRDREGIEKKYGRFQAGLIGFKNNQEGRKVLEWWRKICEEWCFKIEDTANDRWADQKYLDRIPSLFNGVKVLNNLGVNAAPWNLIYNNDFEVKKRDGDIYVEKDKLVAFHFACLSIFNINEFDLWNLGTLQMKSVIKKLYSDYIKDLRGTIRILNNRIDGINRFIFKNQGKDDAKNFYKFNKIREHMDNFDDYYVFCTIASKEYLIKAITLYRSLKKKIDNFQLIVCCVDNTAYKILSDLKGENLKAISVNSIEKENPELIRIKKNRTIKEYCWTLKAPLIEYVMEQYGVQSVIYTDADQYFFQDPKAIIDEWKNYSILMCTQRGDYNLEKIHGMYQAGLLGFRRDNYGLPCLRWWKKRCFEWCYDHWDAENNRWGDQKYLERFPELFQSIKVVRNIGINAAPWNLVFNNEYKVKKENSRTYIDDNELISYHFGSLLIFPDGEFDLWKLEPLNFKDEVIENIYKQYIYEIRRTMNILWKNGVNVRELFSYKNRPQNLYRTKSRR